MDANTKREQETQRMKNVLFSYDNANRLCVDCGKDNVSFASINNGTLVCGMYGCA